MNKKRKTGLILFNIALAFLFIGISACISGIICEINNNELGLTISGIIIAVCGPIALALLIIKFMFFGGGSPSKPIPSTSQSKAKSVRTVDVKEIKKTQDEIMFEKYEELYKQNIITKEDLEKKREELLGKK